MKIYTVRALVSLLLKRRQGERITRILDAEKAQEKAVAHPHDTAPNDDAHLLRLSRRE